MAQTRIEPTYRDLVDSTEAASELSHVRLNRRQELCVLLDFEAGLVELCKQISQHALRG